MSKLLKKTYNLLHLPTCGHALPEDIEQEKNTKTNILFFTGVILVFAGLYGLALGSYLGGIQIIFVLIKLPLLFLSALILTIISAFIIDVVLGSRLKFKQYLMLILLALSITSLALAPLSLILYFFILTTNSHDLIILINAGLFSIAGCFGVYAFFLSRRLLAPKESKNKRRAAVLIWLILYGFVGLQMAWMLKPWVGLLKPDEPVPFLRDNIRGNVYVEIYKAYDRLQKGAYY
ncbi:MAG: hypothetical protein ABH896_03595 [Candidatus Jacksonbacteria bacterium]